MPLLLKWSSTDAYLLKGYAKYFTEPDTKGISADRKEKNVMHTTTVVSPQIMKLPCHVNWMVICCVHCNWTYKYVYVMWQKSIFDNQHWLGSKLNQKRLSNSFPCPHQLSFDSVPLLEGFWPAIEIKGFHHHINVVLASGHSNGVCLLCSQMSYGATYWHFFNKAETWF